MTNSPVFIIVHFFFPVCVCCCLGDSRIAARPTLSIGESDRIRQNVGVVVRLAGVAASGSRYGSLSVFISDVKIWINNAPLSTTATTADNKKKRRKEERKGGNEAFFNRKTSDV